MQRWLPLAERQHRPLPHFGVVNADGTGYHVVTTHAHDSGQDENTDLCVIGVDGRDQVQLTNTPDRDIDPSWVSR